MVLRVVIVHPGVIVVKGSEIGKNVHQRQPIRYIDGKKRIHFLFIKKNNKKMEQNFNVYFPIQLWVSRDATQYRLEPPLLGFKDEYRFHPHFWDALSIPDQDKEKLESYWMLKETLWGWNGKYSPSFHRGFATVAVLQKNDEYPFPTAKISIFRNGNVFYSSLDVYNNSFGFMAYTYPVPGTRLFYVQNNSSDEKILEITYCRDEKGCPPSSNNFFLPNHANKNVSCYDIIWDNYNLFLYLFPEKPRGQYFRLTSTGLCVPSEKETDHPSMLECMKQSAGMRVLPKNIGTGSPLSELQQVMYTYPVARGSTVGGDFVWISVFCFLMSLLLLLFLLLVGR